MRNIFVLILCFTLLFIAFHPDYLNPDPNTEEYVVPDFTEIFAFGYELTFGTIEVFVSIFNGPEALIERFDQWRVAVFGDYTLVSFLDSITDRIPLIRGIKDFFDPLIDEMSDFGDWVKDKIGKDS